MKSILHTIATLFSNWGEIWMAFTQKPNSYDISIILAQGSVNVEDYNP